MTTKDQALAVLTTDINVGMNEVVAVFVAKYEDGLLKKKAEVSAAIKQTKQDLTNLEQDLVRSVNKSAYEGEIAGLGIKAVVSEVKAVWEKTYYTPANVVSVSISLQDALSTEDKTISTITRWVKIPQSVIDDRKNLQSKLEEQNTELLGVMDLIKSVSRKERQIRGRIAEMKLENSGLTALVNEPELLKLVQM